MEELAEINFIATMEGQEGERALANIGFTRFNYTPLEVLAIIQHVQKRIDRVLTDQEIQSGILKDLLADEDYDIVKVKDTLDKDRRRAISDEAKRLYKAEPNLFQAANKEYQELPADERLHDLASLAVIDAKKMNPEQLGIDAIKDQQAANLKYSSSQCAIIPEDQAQTMLAGAMQMLQISGVLELHSLKLQRDALKLINATVCGTATTEFWRTIEAYFGVDEDPDEAALDEAQSLADILRLKTQDKTEDVPSVHKGAAISEAQEEEEVLVDEDDDYISVTSTASASSPQAAPEPPRLKTLAQKRKEGDKKYPNFCSLKEAKLFYPTSSDTLHTTGVNPLHISDQMKIGTYKGYYKCLFDPACEYAAQTHGIVASHLCRVHMGHALACHFCPTLVWWQARYWSEHMDKSHSDQPKFEPLDLPSREIKAEEVDPDHFITEHTFTIPFTQPQVPIHDTKRKIIAEVHQSSKKSKKAFGTPPDDFEEEEDLEEAMNI